MKVSTSARIASSGSGRPSLSCIYKNKRHLSTLNSISQPPPPTHLSSLNSMLQPPPSPSCLSTSTTQYHHHLHHSAPPFVARHASKPLKLPKRTETHLIAHAAHQNKMIHKIQQPHSDVGTCRDKLNVGVGTSWTHRDILSCSPDIQRVVQTDTLCL